MQQPQEPHPVRLAVKDLVLTVPTVVALFLVAGVLGLATSAGHRIWTGQEGGAPMPLPVPQVPLQSTTPAGVLPVLAAALPGKLPSPGPNQKRAGTCDPERAQVAHSGGCWVATDTSPPCPRGKQWEHEGRCWLPVADAKPVPTSGEGRPLGVAEP